MKTFVLALVAVGLTGVAIGMLLYAVLGSSFNAQNFTIATPPGVPTSTSSGISSTLPGIKNASSAQSGVFHGPTDQPHIVGPKANPPNY